jgi:hypothetical protein
MANVEHEKKTLIVVLFYIMDVNIVEALQGRVTFLFLF